MSVYNDSMSGCDSEVDFESDVLNHPATADGMSGRRAEPEDSLNDRNLDRLTLNNPRSGMEIEKDPVDSSSGQRCANGTLRPSPFNYTSQGSSQPYNHDGVMSPYIQRNPRLIMHLQNQSRFSSTPQVETGYVAQCTYWRNDDRVPEQASQHQVHSMWQLSTPSAIHVTSPQHVSQTTRLYRPFAGDAIGLEQKTNLAMHEEDSDFSQLYYYPPLMQQADSGQLSQHERQALYSEGPWSSQNQRTNRPLPNQDLMTTQTQDWSAARDSTGYTPVHLGSETLSNVSSDWDHSTTESSVVPPAEMSDSTATMRPTPYISDTVNIEDEVPMSNFQTQLSRDRASSTTSLLSHIRYDPYFQGFPVQNGSDGFLSDIGTHPKSPTHSVARLAVPHQQQVDSGASSPASAPSPSILDIIRCDHYLCQAEFKGRYRKGNLARHMRLKHGSSEMVYCCKASGCTRDFRRQDARLKHYRKRHPELSTGPASSRKVHRGAELQELDLLGIC